MGAHPEGPHPPPPKVAVRSRRSDPHPDQVGPSAQAGGPTGLRPTYELPREVVVWRHRVQGGPEGGVAAVAEGRSAGLDLAVGAVALVGAGASAVAIGTG